MTIAPTTRLGPYEIVATIGAGGMGEVYHARDSRLGRDVAIKVLPSAYASDPDRLARFEQEARAAGALNHPNILAIYDVGSLDGTHYVVTELLEGQTLGEKLAEGRISTRKAIDYAQQIVRGLAAAHEKGVVHRDLKPENVFVTRDGLVKILDFGLAKLLQSAAVSGTDSQALTLHAHTDPGRILGTAGYMSPEQVRGLPVDCRSDIFAFGTVFYEMVTGTQAFRGDSAVETLNAILKEEPAQLVPGTGTIPPAVARVLSHCLEKDPEDRFQSTQDLAFDLESLTLSSFASGTGRAFGARPARRRSRVPALVALGVVAALAAGLAIGHTFGAGEPAAPPTFKQLTFRRGAVTGARFTPDGESIVYSAVWDGGKPEVFLVRPGTPESRSLDLPNAILLAVSKNGELAVARDQGTLARVSLSAAAPRDVLENVWGADWSPDGNDLAVVRVVDNRFRLEYPIGVALYETSSSVSFMRVSPDGERLAFFLHPVKGDDRGSVMLVDRQRQVTTVTDGWSSLGGLAWSRDGGEIYFTGAKTGANRALYAVAPGGAERLLERVPGSLTVHDVSRDGRLLVTQEDIRGVTIFRGAETDHETDLSWLDGSIVADLSEDGKRVLFYEGLQGGDTDYSVYLRGTDGSPAVRLGEGLATALSPDEKFVLSILPSSPPRLMLLPTGAGEPHELGAGLFERVANAKFFPDGRRVVVVAARPGEDFRCWLTDVNGAEPQAFTPEGVRGNLVTPDMRYLTARRQDSAWVLVPIDGGGQPVLLNGLTQYDVPYWWEPDGKTVYVRDYKAEGLELYRVNISTGKRELWREADPLGGFGERAGAHLNSVAVAPAAKAYAYSYLRRSSDLYLVDGLAK